MTTKYKKRLPSDVDRVVGGNIRTIRKMRGLSQMALADCLNISFQQVQKYEKGTNRVSASRLVMVSGALECQVIDLFAGVAPEAGEMRMSAEAATAVRIMDELPPEMRETALKARQSKQRQHVSGSR